MVTITIQHIPHEACPVCGAGLAGAQVRNRHTNGHWNEVVQFECGATFTWVPNFPDNPPKVTEACPKAMDVAMKARGRC